MINSYDELKQRVMNDKLASKDTEDMRQRALQEWDDMSDDLRENVKDTIRQRAMATAQRMSTIFEKYHPKTENEIVSLYVQNYGSADLPIIETIIKKMHEEKKQKGMLSFNI